MQILCLQYALYVLLLLAGLSGNVHILWQFARSSSVYCTRPRTSLYLALLAVLDLALLCLCLPIELANLAVPMSHGHDTSWCVWTDFIQQVSVMYSSFLVGAMAHKVAQLPPPGYLDTREPEQANRKCPFERLAYGILALISAIVFGVPVLLLGKSLGSARNQAAHRWPPHYGGCVRILSPHLKVGWAPVSLIQGVWALAGAAYVLGSCRFVFSRAGGAHFGPLNLDAGIRQEATTIVLASLALGACWWPLLVANILAGLGQLAPESFGAINQWLRLLAYASSALLPLVYSLRARTGGARNSAPTPTRDQAPRGRAMLVDTPEFGETSR